MVDRYKQHGVEALSDRSRRPYRMANQLPFQVESLIIQIKKEFPNWGAPKIRERMLTRFPDIKTPAKSTVHAVLDRNGLVKHKRANARPKAQGTTLLGAQEPNELWCTDCLATTKPSFSRARTISAPESPGNLGMAYFKSGHDRMAVYLHRELIKIQRSRLF